MDLSAADVKMREYFRRNREAREPIPGQKFVAELIEVTQSYGREFGVNPQVQAVLERPSDEKWFRFLAQKWAIEFAVESNYVSRLAAIPLYGEEYQLARDLLVDQLTEERKHSRLWEKTLIKKGFIKERREVWTHPYFKSIPEYQGFIGWLNTLHVHPIAVMWAGENLSSERVALQTMQALYEDTKDPILKECFGTIVGEEEGHGEMGRKLVAQFATTVEIQNTCRWAAVQSMLVSCAAHQAFARFIKGESRRPYDD